MARQLSTTTRNRYRDAWVAAFPAGTFLRFYSAAPTGVANAPGGTLLGEGTLPATPFTSGTGAVTKNGTWTVTGQAGAGSGTAVLSYRLVNGSDIEEGTVTVTGGGGDLTLDNVSIANAQLATINTFTRTMPDA
jgi:hypothetical protein